MPTMSTSVILPRDVRLFRKSKLGANLSRMGAYAKKGSEVTLGQPFDADYDHRLQLAVKVEGLECDEEVFAIVSEIGEINSRK